MSKNEMRRASADVYIFGVPLLETIYGPKFLNGKASDLSTSIMLDTRNIDSSTRRLRRLCA